MKALLPILLLLITLHTGSAAMQDAQGKTITEIKVIPTRVLQRSVSAKFYKSLLISPIKGLVVVRGALSGTKLMDLKVKHSELNGEYDKLALKLASEVRMAGDNSLERPNRRTTVLLHLLIYEIADGTMALSFAHMDEPGADQMEYYGCAKLAVLKGGRWVDIKGPEGLEGKGLAVRQGAKSDIAAALKVEHLNSGAEATNYGR